MNHEMLQTIFMLSGFLFVVGFLVIIFLVLRRICRGFKNFLFELIDRANGTSPRTNASKTNYTYTYEARKASESVTKKRKQDDTPPWEE